MRFVLTCAVAFSLAITSVMAGEAPPPKFTVKPTATKAADGQVKIEFAVSRETDVAVYVENAKGENVRHLVAGALGKNPPEPLKLNSLAQSIEWDGKDDDGKKAAGGPFKVRVGLGLKASWGETAFCEKDQSGPNGLSAVRGIAAGKNGRVYVMDDRTTPMWVGRGQYAVCVFRRDGSYERTIMPFPANTPPENLKPARAFVNDRGYLNPIVFRAHGWSFYPYESQATMQMGFAGGRLYYAAGPYSDPGTFYAPGNALHLACIDSEGGIPLPDHAGPPLGLAKELGGGFGHPCLTAASDEKSLFMIGFGEAGHWTQTFQAKVAPAVFRVPLPAAGPAQLFFGDPQQSGSDGKRLNNPRAMAADGKGHLLVCDYGNDRVVVLKESDGSLAGSFPVKAPEWVGVHPKTGAVYVYSDRDNIVKFSGWKDARETARLAGGKWRTPVYLGWGNLPPSCYLALDASAEPAVLWIGCNIGVPLWRLEDRGTAFSDPEPAKYFKSPAHLRPASDPTHRMVLCVTDGQALILDEASGAVRRQGVAAGIAPVAGLNQGTHHRLDRDGNIYACGAGGGVYKSDASGKFVPFAATVNDPKAKGHLPGGVGSTGTTGWERDWYVDRRGDIYAKMRGTQYHGPMHLDVFGQDGVKKRTVIWGITDGAYGPRVDAKGNLYIMEAIKPAGQPFPEELKPHVADVVTNGRKAIAQWYDYIYGSIVKFPPAGGNIWTKNMDDKNKPFADPVKLPDALPKVAVASQLRGDTAQMQGHLWMVSGVSHVSDMAVASGGYHCHCTGCDFDIDDFGRSFAPDNGRQRVTVLDANGNTVLHIGGYGNQDYCGPESYVLDPKEKYYRPRRPDDPKELKSPFAEPEIGIALLGGVAVTDKHAYLHDLRNRRVLRVKLDYAATETVALP